jgi:iron complex transport system permease protein
MPVLDISSFAGQAAIRARRSEASVIVRPRSLLVGAVLLITSVAAFLAQLTIGDVEYPIADVVSALFGGADPGTTLIVNELRLPRAAVGALTGLALGASGAIFQSVTRNPLASPEIIGISAGASVVAVAGIVLGVVGVQGVPLSALLGGLATAASIYALAGRRGGSDQRIVLIGIGVGAVCLALTQYLLVISTIYDAWAAIVWLTGSLYGRGPEHLTPLLIGVGVLFPAMIGTGRWLAVCRMGDDTATGLGVPVQRARWTLVVIGVGLVSVATAAAGPIAFVALTSPQIAMRLCRTSGEPPIIAGLLGATMVPICDLLARYAVPGTEFPVGVVTGLVGAPYLLWLLATAHRGSKA